jgi:uncharacterized OsmC-like protein
MTHIQSHHVTVELQKDYQFLVRFDDIAGVPAIACDEPAPLGQGHGPNAAALLGAAVGNCLAASLAFCLRKARLDPVRLSARVVTHVARNERGRFRIARIDVELSPTFAVLMDSGHKRCEDLFEDFCTVTASIRHGIPISVSLKDDAKTAA